MNMLQKTVGSNAPSQSSKRSVWSRRLRLTAFLLTLLSAILVSFLIWPHKSLLDRATRAADASNWRTTYYWLSNQEALIFLQPSPYMPVLKGNRTVMVLSPSGDALLYRYELSTGRETPLTALTEQYYQGRGARWANDLHIPQPVSPDGQWLLWQKSGTLFACRMDGAHLVQHLPHLGANPAPTRAFWLHDSRHILTLTCDFKTKNVQAKVYDLDTPDAVQDLSFAFANIQVFTLNYGKMSLVAKPKAVAAKTATPYAMPNGDDTGIISADFTSFESLQIATCPPDNSKNSSIAPAEDRLLMRKWSADRRAFSLQEIRLNGSRATPLNTVFAPPNGAIMDNFVVSRQGDRAAWLTSTPENSVLHFLRQSVASANRPPQKIVHLYVCRLDGSGTEDLGAMTCAAGDAVEQMQWLPDGKRISFLYRGSLWIVPADG